MDKKKEEMLFPLNNEYRQALIFCENLRRGFNLSVDPMRMKMYSDWFFQKNLEPHFEMEEDFIFSILNDREEIVRQARSYQRKLRRLFLNQKDVGRSLNQAEEVLETYVRFEKKKLISLITEKIDSTKLNLIMNIYAVSIMYEDWGDRFWESKNLN